MNYTSISPHTPLNPLFQQPSLTFLSDLDDLLFPFMTPTRTSMVTLMTLICSFCSMFSHPDGRNHIAFCFVRCPAQHLTCVR